MHEISKNVTTTYKATTESLVIEATKRVCNGKYTVGGTVKKDDKTVATLFIDEMQNTSTIVLTNKEVFSDTSIAADLESNLIGWIKQLIEANEQNISEQ